MGIILTIITLLASLGVFTVMESNAKTLQRNSLQLYLKADVQLIKSEIESAVNAAALISTRPSVIDYLDFSATKKSFSDAYNELNVTSLSLLPSSIRGIALYNQNGKELTSYGVFSKQSDLAVSLKNFSGHVELIWDEQLLLRVALDVKKTGRIIGKVITESPLFITTDAFKNANILGDTGELLLCGSLGFDMECFPTLLDPKPFTVPQVSANGALLPMALALRGNEGFTNTQQDYRNKEVAAAYAPIGNVGLGLVLKVDSSELYAPIWQQIRYLIPLIVVLIIIALLLLRWRVSPMVLKLTSEISQRKRAQQLQQQSEAILFSTINTASDAVVQIDATGIITDWNDQAETTFGWSRAEAIGWEMIETIIPPQYREEHTKDLKHFLATGDSMVLNKRIEITALRSDGHHFPIELAINPLNVPNKILFSSFIRDLTEQRKSEEQLKQAAEALTRLRGENNRRKNLLVLTNKQLAFEKEKGIIRQETDKAKSQFISTVSHELRTPLTSIKGSLGLIQSGVLNHSPEQLQSTIEITYRNTVRLHKLIDEILDLDKPDKEDVGYDIQWVDLTTLLKESIAVNEDYGLEYGVVFVYSGTNEHLWINGDYDRLMQVMGNLLSNAAKFSLLGGQVEVCLERNNGSLRLSVKDYGCGIPESARETIFHKFTQVDSSDQRKKGGSGLGLNIVKTIVGRHGGHIDYTSKVDHGSTFFVDLPELEVEARG